MAQDIGQTQTIRLRKAFRETEYGGVDRTWVFAGGQIVKPTRSERSNSGRHGWDIWQLPAGRYAVITISRPNLKNGVKPFTVQLQCVEVKDGKLNVLASRVMYVMRISVGNLKEWAKAICP